ncbi:MAG: YfcE family phosphodiesterase [Oscillospiraceae bacterium]|nr:YfcE family phosphodiesterase [Oscillospiraceae bacterium]
MNICVFSDSHGCAAHMITAIEREKPALCFFLGDGERDLAAVQARFPALPFYAVRGNCDPRSTLSASLTATVGGVCVFATHGHLYNVKYEPALDSLSAAAEVSGASLALFGHTHHAALEERGGITFLNPGSIGRTAHPAYAVLTLDGARFRAELKTV